MNIVERVKGILLSPKEEWPKIDVEQTDVKTLYTGYVMILAAIPVAASFIGMSLIGFGPFRIPIGLGVGNLIVSYVLALVMLYVIALITDALAPTFGGQKSMIQALKLCAYSYTAAWVAGIFSLIPMLGVIGLIGALYSLYLFYLGVPVMMKCPPDKAIAYTIVVILAAIVLGVIVAAVTGMMFSAGMMGAAGLAR